MEFLYRHPGYQEDYQLYLDNENPELENRILQQDFSDLPNQYDDVQLEKILNNQRAAGRKYPDLTEYNVPDYQNEGQIFSPYYMPQANIGSERFYPIDYRQAPERYAVVKKPRTKKFKSWTGSYLPLRNNRPNFSPHETIINRGKRSRKLVHAQRQSKKAAKGMYHM